MPSALWSSCFTVAFLREESEFDNICVATCFYLMRFLHRDNSNTIRQRVNLPAAKRLSINHKNEKGSHSVSSSFDIYENYFVFNKYIIIFIIYNYRLRMWESNLI